MVFLNQIKGQSGDRSVERLANQMEHYIEHIEKLLLKPKLTENDKKLALIDLYSLVVTVEVMRLGWNSLKR